MKTSAFLPLAAVVMALTACSEATYENHMTMFYPQEPSGRTIYADQTVDSTSVISYDDWTAQVEGDWLTISPTSWKVGSTESAQVRIDIAMQPNTTGQNRSGRILVDGYDKIGLTLYQTKWLNILAPSGSIIEGSEDDITDNEMNFSTIMSPAGGTYTVSFRIYSDGATLTSEADWITVTSPSTGSYKAGLHNVIVSIAENTGDAVRNGQLTLTSAGISTPITFTQLANQD